jgi:hypothetical protein
MSTKIDAFLTEVRNMPGMITASASDPKRLAELEGIERALAAVDRLADEDPAILDFFDKIQTVAGRADLSTKAKLIEVGKLLMQVRDAIKIVH